ncbi:hypothetical protein CBR_g18882 [Chara braunii]|uniref:Reverse transcriptase domain-containing protein n=1 Tax=Chara braunii TaxID=69332 RepID=A0A388KWQ6_CHABU|nr:hypothetical protein CBR_g18882 [Chara braunii]|eukprot:GBG74471.1 hypothetical protein CBR_g18882 [Chara braunii]
MGRSSKRRDGRRLSSGRKSPSRRGENNTKHLEEAMLDDMQMDSVELDDRWALDTDVNSKEASILDSHRKKGEKGEHAMAGNEGGRVRSASADDGGDDEENRNGMHKGGGDHDRRPRAYDSPEGGGGGPWRPAGSPQEGRRYGGESPRFERKHERFGSGCNEPWREDRRGGRGRGGVGGTHRHGRDMMEEGEYDERGEYYYKRNGGRFGGGGGGLDGGGWYYQGGGRRGGGGRGRGRGNRYGWQAERGGRFGGGRRSLPYDCEDDEGYLSGEMGGRGGGEKGGGGRRPVDGGGGGNPILRRGFMVPSPRSSGRTGYGSGNDTHGPRVTLTDVDDSTLLSLKEEKLLYTDSAGVYRGPVTFKELLDLYGSGYIPSTSKASCGNLCVVVKALWEKNRFVKRPPRKRRYKETQSSPSGASSGFSFSSFSSDDGRWRSSGNKVRHRRRTRSPVTDKGVTTKGRRYKTDSESSSEEEDDRESDDNGKESVSRGEKRDVESSRKDRGRRSKELRREKRREDKKDRRGKRCEEEEGCQEEHVEQGRHEEDGELKGEQENVELHGRRELEMSTEVDGSKKLDEEVMADEARVVDEAMVEEAMEGNDLAVDEAKEVAEEEAREVEKVAEDEAEDADRMAGDVGRGGNEEEEFGVERNTCRNEKMDEDAIKDIGAEGDKEPLGGGDGTIGCKDVEGGHGKVVECDMEVLAAELPEENRKGGEFGALADMKDVREHHYIVNACLEPSEERARAIVNCIASKGKESYQIESGGNTSKINDTRRWAEDHAVLMKGDTCTRGLQEYEYCARVVAGNAAEEDGSLARIDSKVAEDVIKQCKMETKELHAMMDESQVEGKGSREEGKGSREEGKGSRELKGLEVECNKLEVGQEDFQKVSEELPVELNTVKAEPRGWKVDPEELKWEARGLARECGDLNGKSEGREQNPDDSAKGPEENGCVVGDVQKGEDTNGNEGRSEHRKERERDEKEDDREEEGDDGEEEEDDEEEDEEEDEDERERKALQKAAERRARWVARLAANDESSLRPTVIDTVAAAKAWQEAAEAERQRLANEAAAQAQQTAEADAAARNRRNAGSTESLIASEHQWTTLLQYMIFVPTETQAEPTQAEAEKSNLATVMLHIMRGVMWNNKLLQAHLHADRQQRQQYQQDLAAVTADVRNAVVQQQQQQQLMNSTSARINGIEAKASAAPGCTMDATKQINERIDHVVTIIGDIGVWMNHLAATHKCTIAELHTHITWKEFEQLWLTRFMVRNVVKAAMNEVYTCSQGNMPTRDWTTKWQKIVTTPGFDLSFSNQRSEFFSRSCAGLRSALGNEYDYTTFQGILDRANLVIQTDDKVANERQSQPHYVAKQAYQRPTHNNAVISEETDDHHAAAASSSDGGIVAALPPKRPKRVRKNKATQETAATGAGQPWTAYKITKEYRDVFEAPTGTVPDRPIRHGITLEAGAVPPRGCIYRMSEEELEVLRAQLDDLLNKGWIRASCSPYSAPVLFVRKKDKDLRLCIDYQKLNAQTVKNAGPLPRIDDLLERLGGATYFSKLDLKSGYHQIEIQPQDRYKTAFKTRYGHFEWVVMPFGLTNAPATFQAAMTTEFRDLLDRSVLIYRDDILVYSRTLDEHIVHLRVVLNRLRLAKYKANLDECEFARQELEYLGHFVMPKGIRPLADKIQTIVDWPEPRCTTDVRSFMGLAGYYQRFVESYSKVAAPLSRLQSPKCHEDGWHPVEYFSRKVPLVNTLEDARKKELLAFVTVLKRWRHFLLGRRRFKWNTDNNPLTFYKTQDTVTSTIGRWMYYIDQFDFDLCYILGPANRAADALSRRPDLCAIVTAAFDLDDDLQPHFVEGYKSDPTYSTLYAELSSDHPPASHYRISDGFLLLHSRGKDLLVVPQDRILRTRLLGEFHDARLSAHLGVNRTLARLRQRFHWPDGLHDVTRYIESCAVCHCNKGRSRVPFGELKPLPIPRAPRLSIAMDVTGTFPRDRRDHDGILMVVDRLSNSARHPQTDGQTERAHQTAEMMLRALIRPDQKDWVDRLPDIEFAYNTSVHPAICVTPFELHHGGEKARIFADLLLPQAADIDVPCSPASIRKYRDLLIKARANMQKAQIRMQQQANRRRLPCPFREGDLVWVLSEEFALEQDVSRKLLPKWFGPWEVTSAVGDDPAGPSFGINIHTPPSTDEFPGHRSQDPRSMDGHQEVDRVITHRKYGNKPRQYKVTFKQCAPNDIRWISSTDLQTSAPLIFADYEKRRLAKDAARPEPEAGKVSQVSTEPMGKDGEVSRQEEMKQASPVRGMTAVETIGNGEVRNEIEAELTPCGNPVLMTVPPELGTERCLTEDNSMDGGLKRQRQEDLMWKQDKVRRGEEDTSVGSQRASDLPGLNSEAAETGQNCLQSQSSMEGVGEADMGQTDTGVVDLPPSGIGDGVPKAKMESLVMDSQCDNVAGEVGGKMFPGNLQLGVLEAPNNGLLEVALTQKSEMPLTETVQRVGISIGSGFPAGDANKAAEEVKATGSGFPAGDANKAAEEVKAIGSDFPAGDANKAAEEVKAIQDLAQCTRVQEGPKTAHEALEGVSTNEVDLPRCPDIVKAKTAMHPPSGTGRSSSRGKERAAANGGDMKKMSDRRMSRHLRSEEKAGDASSRIRQSSKTLGKDSHSVSSRLSVPSSEHGSKERKSSSSEHGSKERKSSSSKSGHISSKERHRHSSSSAGKGADGGKNKESSSTSKGNTSTKDTKASQKDSLAAQGGSSAVSSAKRADGTSTRPNESGLFNVPEGGWTYVDMNGQRQGPFTLFQLQGWSLAGHMHDQMVINHTEKGLLITLALALQRTRGTPHLKSTQQQQLRQGGGHLQSAQPQSEPQMSQVQAPHSQQPSQLPQGQLSQVRPLQVPQVQQAQLPQVQPLHLPQAQPLQIPQGQPLQFAQVQPLQQPQVQPSQLPQMQPSQSFHVQTSQPSQMQPPQTFQALPPQLPQAQPPPLPQMPHLHVQPPPQQLLPPQPPQLFQLQQAPFPQQPQVPPQLTHVSLQCQQSLQGQQVQLLQLQQNQQQTHHALQVQWQPQQCMPPDQLPLPPPPHQGHVNAFQSQQPPQLPIRRVTAPANCQVPPQPPPPPPPQPPPQPPPSAPPINSQTIPPPPLQTGMTQVPAPRLSQTPPNRLPFPPAMPPSVSPPPYPPGSQPLSQSFIPPPHICPPPFCSQGPWCPPGTSQVSEVPLPGPPQSFPSMSCHVAPPPPISSAVASQPPPQRPVVAGQQGAQPLAVTLPPTQVGSQVPSRIPAPPSLQIATEPFGQVQPMELSLSPCESHDGDSFTQPLKTGSSIPDGKAHQESSSTGFQGCFTPHSVSHKLPSVDSIPSRDWSPQSWSQQGSQRPTPPDTTPLSPQLRHMMPHRSQLSPVKPRILYHEMSRQDASQQGQHQGMQREILDQQPPHNHRGMRPEIDGTPCTEGEDSRHHPSPLQKEAGGGLSSGRKLDGWMYKNASGGLSGPYSTEQLEEGVRTNFLSDLMPVHWCPESGDLEPAIPLREALLQGRGLDPLSSRALPEHHHMASREKERPSRMDSFSGPGSAALTRENAHYAETHRIGSNAAFPSHSRYGPHSPERDVDGHLPNRVSSYDLLPSWGSSKVPYLPSSHYQYNSLQSGHSAPPPSIHRSVNEGVRNDLLLRSQQTIEDISGTSGPHQGQMGWREIDRMSQGPMHRWMSEGAGATRGQAHMSDLPDGEAGRASSPPFMRSATSKGSLHVMSESTSRLRDQAELPPHDFKAASDARAPADSKYRYLSPSLKKAWDAVCWQYEGGDRQLKGPYNLTYLKRWLEKGYLYLSLEAWDAVCWQYEGGDRQLKGPYNLTYLKRWLEKGYLYLSLEVRHIDGLMNPMTLKELVTIGESGQLADALGVDHDTWERKPRSKTGAGEEQKVPKPSHGRGTEKEWRKDEVVEGNMEDEKEAKQTEAPVDKKKEDKRVITEYKQEPYQEETSQEEPIELVRRELHLAVMKVVRRAVVDATISQRLEQWLEEKEAARRMEEAVVGAKRADAPAVQYRREDIAGKHFSVGDWFDTRKKRGQAAPSEGVVAVSSQKKTSGKVGNDTNKKLRDYSSSSSSSSDTESSSSESSSESSSSDDEPVDAHDNQEPTADENEEPTEEVPEVGQSTVSMRQKCGTDVLLANGRQALGEGSCMAAGTPGLTRGGWLIELSFSNCDTDKAKDDTCSSSEERTSLPSLLTRNEEIADDGRETCPSFDSQGHIETPLTANGWQGTGWDGRVPSNFSSIDRCAEFSTTNVMGWKGMPGSVQKEIGGIGASLCEDGCMQIKPETQVVSTVDIQGNGLFMWNQNAQLSVACPQGSCTELDPLEVEREQQLDNHEVVWLPGRRVQEGGKQLSGIKEAISLKQIGLQMQDGEAFLQTCEKPLEDEDEPQEDGGLEKGNTRLVPGELMAQRTSEERYSGIDKPSSLCEAVGKGDETDGNPLQKAFEAMVCHNVVPQHGMIHLALNPKNEEENDDGDKIENVAKHPTSFNEPLLQQAKEEEKGNRGPSQLKDIEDTGRHHTVELLREDDALIDGTKGVLKDLTLYKVANCMGNGENVTIHGGVVEDQSADDGALSWKGSKCTLCRNFMPTVEIGRLVGEHSDMVTGIDYQSAQEIPQTGCLERGNLPGKDGKVESGLEIMSSKERGQQVTVEEQMWHEFEKSEDDACVLPCQQRAEPKAMLSVEIDRANGSPSPGKVNCSEPSLGLCKLPLMAYGIEQQRFQLGCIECEQLPDDVLKYQTAAASSECEYTERELIHKEDVLKEVPKSVTEQGSTLRGCAKEEMIGRKMPSFGAEKASERVDPGVLNGMLAGASEKQEELHRAEGDTSVGGCQRNNALGNDRQQRGMIESIEATQMEIDLVHEDCGLADGNKDAGEDVLMAPGPQVLVLEGGEGSAADLAETGFCGENMKMEVGTEAIQCAVVEGMSGTETEFQLDCENPEQECTATTPKPDFITSVAEKRRVESNELVSETTLDMDTKEISAPTMVVYSRRRDCGRESGLKTAFIEEKGEQEVLLGQVSPGCAREKVDYERAQICLDLRHSSLSFSRIDDDPSLLMELDKSALSFIKDESPWNVMFLSADSLFPPPSDSQGGSHASICPDGHMGMRNKDKEGAVAGSSVTGSLRGNNMLELDLLSGDSACEPSDCQLEKDGDCEMSSRTLAKDEHPAGGLQIAPRADCNGPAMGTTMDAVNRRPVYHSETPAKQLSPEETPAVSGLSALASTSSCLLPSGLTQCVLVDQPSARQESPLSPSRDNTDTLMDSPLTRKKGLAFEEQDGTGIGSTTMISDKDGPLGRVSDSSLLLTEMEHSALTTCEPEAALHSGSAGTAPEAEQHPEAAEMAGFADAALSRASRSTKITFEEQPRTLKSGRIGNDPSRLQDASGCNNDNDHGHDLSGWWHGLETAQGMEEYLQCRVLRKEFWRKVSCRPCSGGLPPDVVLVSKAGSRARSVEKALAMERRMAAIMKSTQTRTDYPRTRATLKGKACPVGSPRPVRRPAAIEGKQMPLRVFSQTQTRNSTSIYDENGKERGNSSTKVAGNRREGGRVKCVMCRGPCCKLQGSEHSCLDTTLLAELETVNEASRTASRIMAARTCQDGKVKCKQIQGRPISEGCARTSMSGWSWREWARIATPEERLTARGLTQGEVDVASVGKSSLSNETVLGNTGLGQMPADRARMNRAKHRRLAVAAEGADILKLSQLKVLPHIIIPLFFTNRGLCVIVGNEIAFLAGNPCVAFCNFCSYLVTCLSVPAGTSSPYLLQHLSVLHLCGQNCWNFGTNYNVSFACAVEGSSEEIAIGMLANNFLCSEEKNNWIKASGSGMKGCLGDFKSEEVGMREP